MFHRATKTTHSHMNSYSSSHSHPNLYPIEIKIFPVRIPNTNTNKNTSKKIKSVHEYVPQEQYSLTHTFFDPSRSSPPNYFMSHLQERLEKMDVNRNKE